MVAKKILKRSMEIMWKTISNFCYVWDTKILARAIANENSRDDVTFNEIIKQVENVLETKEITDSQFNNFANLIQSKPENVIRMWKSSTGNVPAKVTRVLRWIK